MIEQGCNLAAVNNDGELAVDIAESDEMEDLLQQHINKAGKLLRYLFVQMKIFIIKFVCFFNIRN